MEASTSRKPARGMLLISCGVARALMYARPLIATTQQEPPGAPEPRQARSGRLRCRVCHSMGPLRLAQESHRAWFGNWGSRWTRQRHWDERGSWKGAEGD